MWLLQVKADDLVMHGDANRSMWDFQNPDFETKWQFLDYLGLVYWQKKHTLLVADAQAPGRKVQCFPDSEFTHVIVGLQPPLNSIT